MSPRAVRRRRPPQTTAEPSPPATAAACAAEIAIDWTPAGGPPLKIAASAAGAACDAGVAKIAVTDAAGRSLFAGDYDIAPMTTTVFAEAKTPETLKVALQQWIDPADAMMPTTQQLPAWAPGADAPQDGEFPFYPAEGMTRDAYARLRVQALPISASCRAAKACSAWRTTRRPARSPMWASRRFRGDPPERGRPRLRALAQVCVDEVVHAPSAYSVFSDTRRLSPA